MTDPAYVALFPLRLRWFSIRVECAFTSCEPNTHLLNCMMACVTTYALESVAGKCPRYPATIEIQASGALRRRRRQQRLDQLEIPVSELEITDEVLGRGGFGTVYLADLNGLNAAAKVIVFEDELGEDEDEDGSDDDDDDDATAATNGEECRQPSKPETVEAAAASSHKRLNNGEPEVSLSHQHRQQRRAFMRELEAMKRLRGPHTVTIYGAVTSLPDRLILVSCQAASKRHAS